jgi:peptidoglycan/LPS O-acetylase OafA/YrhL
MTIHSMNRSAVIDSIKALASQVIVLHHFCVYAPMTDWLADAWPRIVELLHEDGRLAVQPFLVVGGFLAAQSLGKQVGPRLAPLIWRRYLRLAPQLALSLLLVMAATWWMGDELAHEDWLSPLPSAGVFLAHLFFLQDVLGIEAMSAGVWYLAIDLQLFALFGLLTQISRRAKVPLAQTYAPVLVAGATVTSIHVFSKASILDIWAIYYLSAYGLGALVIWARDCPAARKWLWITVALLLLDWVADPRPRPLLALATAMALYGLSHIEWTSSRANLAKAIRTLSNISYSTFVSHFAVIIAISGLWEKLDLQGPAAALGVTAFAIMACWVVGAAVQKLSDLSLRRMQAQ